MSVPDIIVPVKMVSEKEFREMYEQDEDGGPDIKHCVVIDQNASVDFVLTVEEAEAKQRRFLDALRQRKWRRPAPIMAPYAEMLLSLRSYGGYTRSELKALVPHPPA